MSNNFLALVEAKRPDIEALLPAYLTGERFFALIRQIEKNPKLMECTPESLLECVIKAAQCGFEIGGPDDHCYLIPYGKQAQLQTGWRGLVYRLVQAHAASHIFAETVREGDEFHPTLGTKRDIVHTPGEKRGKIVKAYAVAILPNGIIDFEILEADDIDAIEKAALRISNGKPSPAWQFFRGEMIKKSAIKRLGKRLQGDRRASPDEMARLQATLEIREEIDLGRVKQAEKANEDIQAPPPAGGGRKVEPEVESAPTKSDANDPITDDEQGLLLEQARAKGIKTPSALLKFINTTCGIDVDDLDGLKKSHIMAIVAKLAE